MTTTPILRSLLPFATAILLSQPASTPICAAEPTWTDRPELMRPIWKGEVMEGESILFIKDAEGFEARASVFLPIRKILSVRDSSGATLYEEGRDYSWKPNSREIVLPRGSRIVASRPADLRRPPKSQMFALSHRDGGDEILFGARLEYQALQTIITYEHSEDAWTGSKPSSDRQGLSRTVAKLEHGEPLSLVVLGDSISTGCNASGWAGGAPYQPAYPDLFRRELQSRFGSEIKLTNLSVGGMDSAWALTKIDAVVETTPDLVIIAFGMNDAGGRPANEFRDNIAQVVAGVKERRPEAEFILVATMVGNPDWIHLRQDRFPAYRDALAELRAPGVALADVTSIWRQFLERKHDWDQTGNGVNHPNDFGHRVYAQVLSSLLIP